MTSGKVSGGDVRIGDLEGLRVLMIGASGGIGAAVADAYAAQGARQVLHYHRGAGAVAAQVDALKAAGHWAAALGGDVTQRQRARELVAEAATLLGGLDLLVNMSGSLIERRPILEVDDALFDASIDLNARAVLQACQAAVPHLQASGKGSIINVGSIAGVDGGGPGSGHYAAAKAYVHALTKHLARDLAKLGIRVNAVSPGVVRTPFHAKTPPERMQAMQAAIPMGRIGEPGDCVGAFLFLASPALSAYITGQVLHVNGGQYMA